MRASLSSSSRRTPTMAPDAPVIPTMSRFGAASAIPDSIPRGPSYRLALPPPIRRNAGGVRGGNSLMDVETPNRKPLPLAQLLGIRFREAGRERVVAEMTVRADLCTAGERAH